MASQRTAGPVLALVLAAGLASCGPASRQPVQLFLVTVEAHASPTCPVEVDPPDPECAPRPVSGATIRILSPSGRTVQTLTTDESGTVTVSLPAGTYTFHPEPVEGLPGIPDPETLSVADDLPGLGVVFEYDAGARVPAGGPEAPSG